ncbi:hypothetical protein M422DRAFT_254389 [Sphaerobolus stellatus SS14]|uniref:Uncharacterized protein n=1 Tax=Sphaerobolus stellatus (strain SS14) TaxID=990650 RepID=A0A0C9VVJ6_SPHS4|nr:hypothetical protein M422DRAFT_254389 [Sphaerobolus stellatus SS14]
MHDRSAEVMAASTAFRNTFCAITSAAVLPSIKAIGIATTNTIFALMGWLTFILIIIVIKYGKQLRDWSDMRYTFLDVHGNSPASPLHRRTRQILCDTPYILCGPQARPIQDRRVDIAINNSPKKTLQSSLLVSHMGFHSSALEHLATHSPYRELYRRADNSAVAELIYDLRITEP